MMDNNDFRAIYDSYFNDVLRFVRSMVRTEKDVEEIVQDVFVRVARNFENYRSHAQLKTWILAIAKNAIKDFWRKEKRLRAKDTVDLDGLPEAFWATPPQEEPEEQLLQTEELAQIRRCIDKLPESMRLVLLCRIIHELSVQETADVLGWTSARVRVTHMRGLKKFHDLWQAQSTQTALQRVSTSSNSVAK